MPRIRTILLSLTLALMGYIALLTLIPLVAPLPATPLMLIRAAQGYGWKHDWLPLSKMPKSLPRAAIASEDNLFCTHNGVDWQAVNLAYTEWQQGQPLRGASTISMQTAKNVFLWPNQTFIRKALEVPLTYLIEAAWGKRRIMEVYLNVAEWGPGVYGIGAAARHHYGKPAHKLTSREVAYLVAILPSPLRWTPSDMPLDKLYRAETLPLRMLQIEAGCIKP